MSTSPPKSILKPAAAKYFCSSPLSQSHYHLLLRLLQGILTGVPASSPAPNPMLCFPQSAPSTSLFSLLPAFHFMCSCVGVEFSEHPPALSVHLYLQFLPQIPSCPLTLWQTPTRPSNLSPNASSVLLYAAHQTPTLLCMIPCRSSFNVCLNK